MLALDALRDLGRVVLRVADPRTTAMVIEEDDAGPQHVVRVELPGREPDELSVSVADNEVTIEVRPKIRVPRPTGSEFTSASRRRFMLPRGSKDDTLAATYDHGILELRVRLERRAPIGRRVPVRVGPNGAGDPNAA